MLARLRHWSIIGGDNHQGAIDTRYPRNHGVDKTMMTGHVDKTDDSVVT